MLATFESVFTFIAAIAALILIHEIGHYLAARSVKVDVEEFGLGIPPKALRLFTWRGTEFTLNWIPLGGFVRLKGEIDDMVEGGFMQAHPLKRIWVLIAGPLANILTAILLFSMAAAIAGRPVTEEVLVNRVNAGSPASLAGIQPGDQIVRVDGMPIAGIGDVQSAIGENLGQPTEFVLERDGQQVTVALTPLDHVMRPGEYPVGISMTNPTEPISLLDAGFYGTSMVGLIGYNLISLPAQLIEGSIAPEEARLVGFRGMFDMYTTVREAQTVTDTPVIASVMLFFGMISTSLGLLNLLPVPALDGGRILFTMPELLFGRRIPPQLENIVNMIGFSLLLLLLIVINANDFINPVNFAP